MDEVAWLVFAFSFSPPTREKATLNILSRAFESKSKKEFAKEKLYLLFHKPSRASSWIVFKISHDSILTIRNCNHSMY
jgi:hypothetical protein